MDKEGTTDTAIKIKWASVTNALRYNVSLDGKEIAGNLNSDVTQFVFDSTSLANFQEVKQLSQSKCQL